MSIFSNFFKKEAPLLGLQGSGGGLGFLTGGGGDYIDATYSGEAQVTESGDYRTIVWTAGNGNFTINAVKGDAGTGGPNSEPYMDIAMMGGGAAGAERHGPGAPAGGMILAYSYQASTGNYPITVAATRPGNNNSTGPTPGNPGNGFGFTVVGGGSPQPAQPNPGNALNFNQYNPGSPAGGPGDQGGGGHGTGGAGQSGGGNVGHGGPGLPIPINPGSYGSGGKFGGGGAGAGRGGSGAPGSPGGGGGNPNGNGVAHTGSGGGGGRDSRQTTGSGAGGICMVRYKYQ